MTGFNIETFKARGLFSGGARPTLFEVRMSSVPVDAGQYSERLSFLASAASIPAAALDQIEVPYFGRRIKLFGERVFTDWTITVLNDEDFNLRDMFESWSNKMNTMISNRQDSSNENLLDYKIDNVEVLQYGKAGPGDDSGVVRSYQFMGMWPRIVRDIPLDWGQGTRIEMFDVVMAYDEWVPTKIGSSNPSYAPVLSPA